jgi:hypothetical protein
MREDQGQSWRQYQPTGLFDEFGREILADEFGVRAPRTPNDAGKVAETMPDPKQAELNQFLEASRQDAANNLEFAKYATVANRANQFTPYGSSTWQRGATDNDPWTQTTSLSPEGQRLFDLENQLNQKYGETANLGFDKVRGLFENPVIDTSGMPSLRGIDMSKVSGIRGLNADGLQNIRGLSTEGLQNVRGLNTEGLQNIRGLTLDGLPSTALAPGQIAQDALLSRINPSLMADEESLRSRLANQGIGLGSAAYGREMGLQGQRATDLRLQAAAQGIGIDQAARQQALGERQALSQFDMGLNAQQFGQRQAMSGFDMAQRNQQFGERQALGQFDMAQRGQQFGERQAMSGFDMGLNAQQFGQQEALSNQAARQRAQMMEESYAAQSRPLDLVNALRSGSQVTNPTFGSYAQQATTSGGNTLGVLEGMANRGLQRETNAAELAQSRSNAKSASSDALMSGIFSLGAAGMKAGLF